VNDPVLRAADLLVHPVLTRDRQAMADLVLGTLGPSVPEGQETWRPSRTSVK
jgi:hypothetical protein